ncbi:MAG: hypothetical protein GY807_24875 [Gammaproteobacteria bacterium]|nr:hypothetical protein [Gammaproteobacteria bacterium]
MKDTTHNTKGKTMKINLDMRKAKASVKEFIRLHNIARRELRNAREYADKPEASYADGHDYVGEKYAIYKERTDNLFFLGQMGIVKQETLRFNDYRYERFSL